MNQVKEATQEQLVLVAFRANRDPKVHQEAQAPVVHLDPLGVTVSQESQDQGHRLQACLDGQVCLENLDPQDHRVKKAVVAYLAHKALKVKRAAKAIVAFLVSLAWQARRVTGVKEATKAMLVRRVIAVHLELMEQEGSQV